MTSTELLTSSLADATAKVDRLDKARAAHKAAEEALEAAKAELRAAGDGWRGEDHHGRLVRLQIVGDAIAGGASPIAVHTNIGSALPGAVIRVTAARVVVLTERGEWEFDRNRDATGRRGKGRGDAKYHRIDLADVPGLETA